MLQHSQFRTYFAASLASNVGTWLQNTAQILLAYQLAHSVFWVGVVTCAQFSGSLFLGPWAAVLANRFDGKRMLIGTQLFSACVASGMALLQVSGLLTEQLLIVGALGLGLAFAFALPVQVSLVPRLSPEDEAESALAMNSVSYNTGRAVAPVLCVIVVNTLGFGWVFMLNAITFLFLAAGLARIEPRLGPRGPIRPARARDGISIARNNPEICLLLGMVAAVTIADDPILVLGPTLAHHVLGVSDAWPGYFLAALGCGTVLGSFLPSSSTAHPRSSTGPRRAALSLLALSLFMALFVAGISPAVSLAAACGTGMAALTTGAFTQVSLIRQSPYPYQAGSVMALWAIAWAGTKPIASLVDGWLGTVLGVRFAGMILILPALTLGVFGIIRPGRSREVAPRLYRQPEQSEAEALIRS